MFAHLRFHNGETFSINGKRYICSKPGGILQPQPEFAEGRNNTSLKYLGELPEQPPAAALPEKVEIAIEVQAEEPVQIVEPEPEPELEPEIIDVVDVEELLSSEGDGDADN
jgi:hypothetical protein